MLFVKKHHPKNVNEIFFHQDKYERLKKMAVDNELPHIIVHGPRGSGKRTMIEILLQMVYDESVKNTRDATYKVSTSSNKIIEETIKQSDHHIVIQPTGTNYDKNLIQDVTKTYANIMPFDIFETNKNFKVIQINNLDNVSDQAQTALRRTIENYSSTCRFIMWCESLSKVILPIISRCVCIRLAAPSPVNMAFYIMSILYKENLLIPVESIREIIKHADGNIKSCLWYLNYFKANSKPQLKNGHLLEIDLKNNYNYTIEKIGKIILSSDKSQYNKQLTMFTDSVYYITITGYKNQGIMEDILDYILDVDVLSEEKKINIINEIAPIDHLRVRSRRVIYHFINMFSACKKIIYYK